MAPTTEGRHTPVLLPSFSMTTSMPDTPATSASPALLVRLLQRPWLGVLSRSLAAMVGGYALALSSAACMALVLPMPRSQAVLTGMMIAIVLCACAALWAFATRSALRAWVGIGVPAALCWAVVKLHGGAA